MQNAKSWRSGAWSWLWPYAPRRVIILSPPVRTSCPSRQKAQISATASVARSSLLPLQFPGNARGRPVLSAMPRGNSHAPSDHAVRKRRKPRHAGPAHMHTPHATAPIDGSDHLHVATNGQHRRSGAGHAARSHSTPVHSGGRRTHPPLPTNTAQHHVVRPLPPTTAWRRQRRPPYHTRPPVGAHGGSSVHPFCW
jgi:hypothetical protein